MKMPQSLDFKKKRDLGEFCVDQGAIQGNLRDFGVFASGLTNPAIPAPDGVVGRDGNPSERRFGVYRNNVMSSLIDALSANFPALHDLVGRDYFRALAAEFVRQSPPEQPVLSEFGGKFPAFIAGFPPLADYPYLKDVAAMEWVWLRVYHGADAAPMAADALSKIDAERLGEVVFTAIPSSQIVYSRFPLSQIWQKSRGDVVTGVTPEADQAILICRPEMDVTLSGLAQDVASFAELLFFGKSLGEAAEKVAETYQDFDLSQALGCLLSARVFASVELKTAA